MHPILKTVFAILVGVAVAMCVVVLTESLAERYFPAHHLSPTLAEREEDIRTAPLIAMLIFLGGFACSSFFGSYAAARIAPEDKKFMSGITVGFFLLLGGLVYFITTAFPLWLSISTCIGFPVFSALAVYIARRGKLI